MVCYRGSGPTVPGDVGRKYQVWPLMPGLLSGELQPASCLSLVGAASECSPAFCGGLLNLHVDYHRRSVVAHLPKSVIYCSYLLERNYILYWNVNLLLLLGVCVFFFFFLFLDI